MSTQTLLIFGGIGVLILIGLLAFLVIDSRRGAGRPAGSLWPPTYFFPDRLPSNQASTRTMPAMARTTNINLAPDATQFPDMVDTPTSQIARKPEAEEDQGPPTNMRRPDAASPFDDPDTDRTSQVRRSS